MRESKHSAAAKILAMTNLSLPEITASRAQSWATIGIAHMAAAAEIPLVGVLLARQIVRIGVHGHRTLPKLCMKNWSANLATVTSENFDEPECIKRVPVERVTAAIERV